MDKLAAAACCSDPKVEQLVHEMLIRVADKWTLLVIYVLEDGELRFSRIQERVHGISQKMLTKTLRQLERDGLVARHVYAEVPPRVDYRLTDLGESLAEAMCGVWEWAAEHLADVDRARNAFAAMSRAASAANASDTENA
jgi:DNA-binding HxlR family transcriptional regulator